MHIPQAFGPYFKALAALGIVVGIVDTVMSAVFGFQINIISGIGLAAVSVASGLLLVIATFFHRAGMRGLGNGLAAAWVCAFAFNVWSNMGVATSGRMGDVQAASVQKTTYGEAQKRAVETEDRLKVFSARLNDLTTQNAWVASVKADGLHEKVKALENAEAAEAKLGGCKAKCRAIQNEIVEVKGRIAVAEQRDDLDKQIKATEKILADARSSLAGTKAGISATANQSTLYAKLISFNLADDPDAPSVTVANEVTGIAMALVIAILSAALNLAGAWPHLAGVGRSTMTAVRESPLTRSVGGFIERTHERLIDDREFASRIAALKGA